MWRRSARALLKDPEGASFDFKGPQGTADRKAWTIWYWDTAWTVCRLSSVCPGEWSVELKGPLLQEHEPGIRTFECPDF